VLFFRFFRSFFPSSLGVCGQHFLPSPFSTFRLRSPTFFVLHISKKKKALPPTPRQQHRNLRFLDTVTTFFFFNLLPVSSPPLRWLPALISRRVALRCSAPTTRRRRRIILMAVLFVLLFFGMDGWDLAASHQRYVRTTVPHTASKPTSVRRLPRTQHCE
jgi:hypothetical protein